jgi:hypothetical protein
MSILKLLSSSLGVNNEIPNQKLAEEIATTNNSEAIKELVETLQSSKDKKQQSDCIKVLYETGYKKPELIAHDLPVFVQFIKSKNNRLVWGAMIAIASIAKVKPNEVHTSLAEIMQAVDKGSVITKDCGVMILVQLASKQDFTKECFPLLMEQLKFCPAKQLPQYAEKSVIAISDSNKQAFVELLEKRMKELEKDSQKKRIEKVLRKL